MKYLRVASACEKRLLQEVYMNKALVDNPVIPELTRKNVDEMVHNSQIMWKDGGNISCQGAKRGKLKIRAILTHSTLAFLWFSRVVHHVHKASKLLIHASHACGVGSTTCGSIGGEGGVLSRSARYSNNSRCVKL